MRQAKARIFQCRTLLFLILCAVFITSGTHRLEAQIADVSLQVSYPGSAEGAKINGAAQVQLQASWTGGTAPYSASFKVGGNTLGSESTSGTTATFVVPGSTIGQGDGKSFEVVITDRDNNSGNANGDQTVSVDLLAPTLEVVLNGSTFSNNPGSNIVEIRVSSNKNILAPTVTVDPDTLGTAPTAESSNPAFGTSFRYRMELTTAPGGTYAVKAVGRDTTQPEVSANTGTAQRNFSVSSAAPGSGAITSVSPNSPTNAQNITLTGTVHSGWDPSKQVEIREGGATAANGTISGGQWTATINDVTEGTHSYTVRGRDNFDNWSSESAPFQVKIDRTPPGTPALNEDVTSPTNASSVTLSGSGAVESGTLTSTPVTVKIFDWDGNEVAQASAGTGGSFTVSGVPLQVGENRFYAMAYDATNPSGNASGRSNTISVIRDESSGGVVGIYVARAPGMPSMPTPIAQSYYLGAGTYQVRVNFDKNMDQTSNTKIDIQTPNGTTISASGGSWTDARNYSANFTIPQNGGDAIDGRASFTISGAKDTAGNEITPHSEDSAMSIDSTPPVASFNSDTDIYVASNTTSVALRGTVNDSGGSGVGYVELVWQSNSDPSIIASQPVPIMSTSPSPWSHNWDPSSLAAGRYKLWVIGADRANPNPNLEDWKTKTTYRTVIVDKTDPVVERISLDNLTVDINAMAGGEPPVIASSVTKLNAKIVDNGESGIDFTGPNFVFSLVHDETSTPILGNYGNNGNDLVTFDFPNLTQNGTYTVTVTPADKGGNTGPTETRQFVIDRNSPTDVTFFPPDQSIANESHETLSQGEVRAVINHPRPDYVNSTIEVRYNGNIVGYQAPNAGEQYLIWKIHGDEGMAIDQSHDGRYDITVTPRDTLGNIGAPVRAFFTYDCIFPVITNFEPAKTKILEDPVWFGLDQQSIYIEVSDAPKDIIKYAHYLEGGTSPVDVSNIQIPGDPNWYSGNGSGVNMTVSSFTYTVDGVESGPATAAGNRLSLPRPNAPAEGPGVVDVNVNAILHDRVTSGETIPNVNIASYSYKFDYLAPRIEEITLPDPKNNKYCKNVVKVTGKAVDQGESDELEITAIEWSDDGVAWAELPTSGLGSKEVKFESTIDITSLADGEYTIHLRAKDKGGNYSSSMTTTYVVDRTPPEPPELIVPLPGLATNKRGHLFKWASAVDADHYAFQVSDDAAFSSVLNHQMNSQFPGVTGQITPMQESAYSVPKDGTYYWRVASIETCADGFNISKFSSSRKFTVDTVRPTVVSVLPSPSESNKISTGMVTFTIRFSELIDATAPLSVKLTSSGGEVMGIEKVSSSEDTWIGTTVIPKNDSALYDGPAIISIEGATDIAGNMMVPDSSNSVIINTGPAFQTRIFSNPANPFEIMIVSRASEPLQGPPTCTVQQSTVKTPVTMNFLKERYYAGSYKIDIESPGKAYIDIAGTDLHGMTGRGSVEFVVADLSASQRLNMASINGHASLKGAENSAYAASSIFMLDREYLESPFAQDLRASSMPGEFKVRPVNGTELVGLVPLELVGPTNLALRKRLLYTADVSDQKINAPAEKVHLYRLNDSGEWVFQGGNYADGVITAELTGLGRLALMADLTEPGLAEFTPADREELDNSTPEIKGQIVDFGSGVVKESFRLFINDQEVSGAKLGSDGRFSYQVRQPLPKGRHDIVVEAEDLAGNQLRSSSFIVAPGAFAVDEFMTYPNPATGNRVLFNYNFNQKAERVRLRIYDTAGQVVTDFDTFDFANLTSGRIRWDLRNKDGRMVANGVYFYRLQVTRNGQTLSKRGSFAVMR